jgi:hypothetical protein
VNLILSKQQTQKGNYFHARDLSSSFLDVKAPAICGECAQRMDREQRITAPYLPWNLPLASLRRWSQNQFNKRLPAAPPASPP